MPTAAMAIMKARPAITVPTILQMKPALRILSLLPAAFALLAITIPMIPQTRPTTAPISKKQEAAATIDTVIGCFEGTLYCYWSEWGIPRSRPLVPKTSALPLSYTRIWKGKGYWRRGNEQGKLKTPVPLCRSFVGITKNLLY